MYAIGLDIGTTSVCGILHSIENGEIVKSITLPNNTFISTANEWEKIQDTKKLLGILQNVADSLLAENLPVKSIGITGQMHGIVYLDKSGNILSELKIWQDGRGNLEYKDGKTYAEYITEKTGYPIATGFGAVTYFYDEVNSALPENTATFCTIHDLAAMTLCGNSAPLVHPSDAASFGLYDIKNNRFDKDAIETLGLDYSIFPKISKGIEKAGEYKGIPVSVAIGDNQASFIGSVNDMEHSILINVGTGSQISCLTHTVPDDKSLDCRPLLDGSYILAGSALAGGRAYAVLEKFFREIAETVTGEKVKSSYPAIDKLMENLESLNSPLNIDTAFSGTRANPEKRGSIANISTENFTMAHFCDGVMCGMANELYGMYENIKISSKTAHEFMIGSGNGIRFNQPLRQRFERIFSLPIKMPAHKEEAAFGASLYGLCAAGIFSDIKEAQKLIKYCEVTNY